LAVVFEMPEIAVEESKIIWLTQCVDHLIRFRVADQPAFLIPTDRLHHNATGGLNDLQTANCRKELQDPNTK
jgi:hypothetical protein